MKTYEKPRLMALSLSGNDQLCGSCSEEASKAGRPAELLYKDPTGSMAKDMDWLIGDGDGTLTKAEVAKAFGPGENCEIEYNNYCKFTSTGTVLVAWS